MTSPIYGGQGRLHLFTLRRHLHRVQSGPFNSVGLDCSLTVSKSQEDITSFQANYL